MSRTVILLNLVIPFFGVSLILLAANLTMGWMFVGSMSFFASSVQLSVALVGFALTVIALITNLIAGSLGSGNKYVQEAIQENKKLKSELYSTFFILSLTSALALILSLASIITNLPTPQITILSYITLTLLAIATWNLFIGVVATYGIIKYYLFEEI